MRTIGATMGTTLALALVLAGCGGGNEDSAERARTVAAPTTAAPTAIEDFRDEPLTEAQLESALLTVPDLPTGYTATADDGEDDNDEGGTTSEDAECEDRFADLDASEDLAVATVDAEFESGLGVFLEQELSSFGDEDQLKDRIDNVVDVLSDCPSFSTTDDDGVVTEVTIGQLSFPKLGDDTVALAFTGTTDDADIRFNLVVVRVGRNLMSILQGGLVADPAVLEQATRAGLDKLAAAGG